MRFVCIIFPFQYKPENNSCKRWWIGIYLALNCWEPESVTESINQCTNKACTFDGDSFCKWRSFTITHNQSTWEVGNGPKQEHDTRCRKQCAHGVNHTCYLCWVACKMWEEIGCKHKEWCPRRVSNLQFIACCNEFGTVPETGCRFNCGTVDEGCNKECKPSDDVVHQSELFHLYD